MGSFHTITGLCIVRTGAKMMYTSGEEQGCELPPVTNGVWFVARHSRQPGLIGSIAAMHANRKDTVSATQRS